MRKFIKTTTETKATPVADMTIDLALVKQIRLGVYTNTNVENKSPVADVIIRYKDDTTLNIKNNLSKWQNVFYRMPTGYEALEPWYKDAFDKAKAWGKQHSSNLHCKLGMRCNTGQGDRYHTVPCTLFSFDPALNMAYLQIATPGTKADRINFDEYTEIEFELTRKGNRTLIYEWTGEADE